jgi:hypothetical protein
MIEARLSAAARLWMLIFAAILLPVAAGLIALTLVHATDPSTVVIIPADVDHHTPERLAIVAAGVVGSAVLFGFVGRVASAARAEG